MNFASIRRYLHGLSWLRRADNPSQSLGRRGERAAARYVRRRRHRVLARNYASPAGEIDLIFAEGETIVFVEVKTRTSENAEDPACAVRPRQWARIEQAARYFLMEHAAQHRPCRFDLITIVWPHRGAQRIEHFEDVGHSHHR